MADGPAEVSESLESMVHTLVGLHSSLLAEVREHREQMAAVQTDVNANRRELAQVQGTLAELVGGPGESPSPPPSPPSTEGSITRQGTMKRQGTIKRVLSSSKTGPLNITGAPRVKFPPLERSRTDSGSISRVAPAPGEECARLSRVAKHHCFSPATMALSRLPPHRSSAAADGGSAPVVAPTSLTAAALGSSAGLRACLRSASTTPLPLRRSGSWGCALRPGRRASDAAAPPARRRSTAGDADDASNVSGGATRCSCRIISACSSTKFRRSAAGSADRSSRRSDGKSARSSGVRTEEQQAEVRAKLQAGLLKAVSKNKEEQAQWRKLVRKGAADGKWAGALLTSAGETKKAQEAILGTALKVAALDEDNEGEADELPWGILHPSSPARLSWDVVSILLVVYITGSLPYRLAFLADEHNTGLVVLDFLIDVFFVVDILINLRTAFMSDGQLVTAPRAIMRHYLRTWFLLDLCSSLPIEWFIFGVSFESRESEAEVQALSLLKTFKILKLLRLLRLARLLRYFSNWQEEISDHFSWLNASVLRLCKTVVMMFVLIHWNGCIQFLMAGYASPGLTGGGDTWVELIGLHHMSPSRQYAYSFFCAANQMLALDGWNGGIAPPTLTHELVFNLISVLSGGVVYALFVAQLTAVISESNPAARAYRAKVDVLNQYMRYARLPRELRMRLRSYMEMAYPSRSSFDERAILSELTGPLQQAVRLERCGHVLDTLHVVHVGGDPGLPGAIAQALQHTCYVTGDFILRQGTKPEGMYFLTSGEVEVVKREEGSEVDVVLTSLRAGSFFGEMALLSESGRAIASVRVKASCTGHFLSRAHYQEIVTNFPNFKAYLSTIAKLRLESRQQRGKKLLHQRWRMGYYAAKEEDDDPKGRAHAADAGAGGAGAAHAPMTLPEQSAMRMQAAFKRRKARIEFQTKLDEVAAASEPPPTPAALSENSPPPRRSLSQPNSPAAHATTPGGRRRGSRLTDGRPCGDPAPHSQLSQWRPKAPGRSPHSRGATSSHWARSQRLSRRP